MAEDEDLSIYGALLARLESPEPAPSPPSKFAPSPSSFFAALVLSDSILEQNQPP